MPPKQNHFVFVYGSLKRGFVNHRVLEGQTFIGTGIIKGTMLAYCSYFPGCCNVGNDNIHGEVFAVDDETLSRLDQLEGHPQHYERKYAELVGLSLDDIVWCYFLPESVMQEGHYKRIPSGEWKEPK